MGDTAEKKTKALGTTDRDEQLLNQLYEAYKLRNEVGADTKARELTILWGMNKWGLDKDKIEELCNTYIAYDRRYTLPAIFYAQLEANNQPVQDANARRNTIEAVLRESDNLQLVEPVPGVQQVPVAQQRQMFASQPPATQQGLKRVAGRLSAARQRAGEIANTVRTRAQGARGQVRSAFRGARNAAAKAIQSRWNTANEQAKLDMQAGTGPAAAPAPAAAASASVPMATAVPAIRPRTMTLPLKPPASRIKF